MLILSPFSVIDSFQLNFILVLLLSWLVKLARCSPIVEGKIIRQSDNASYSFMVSLQEPKFYKNGTFQEFSHICGGALVTDIWILTAAHCVYNRDLENLSAIIGSVLLNADDIKRYFIKNITLFHFSAYATKNDIALLQIADKTKVHEPLNLPQFDLGPTSNDCKILGYGSTEYAGSIQNQLHEANVKLITNDECVSKLGRVMGPDNGDNTVCAIGENGEDTCQGDSGGPLICFYNDTQYLYGIVSHGISCGGEGIPSLYTIVDGYLYWIYEIINSVDNS